jgi:hypothetical protein
MGGTEPILGADGSVSYTAVPAAACSSGNGRFGEVAEVIPADEAKALASRGGNGSAIDWRCIDAVFRYVGLASGGAIPMFRSWRPAAGPGVLVSGPSQLQASAGQKWAACIALVEGPDGQSLHYERPLKNMFAAGHLTSALSVCDPTVNLVGDCGRPHEEEMLADAAGTPRSAAALTSSCLALAKAFTGMPDPTAAGRLKVYVTTPPENAAESGPVPQCVIASTNKNRKLAGPLIGLGTKPVPWQ